MKRTTGALCVLSLIVPGSPALAQANEIADWNAIMFQVAVVSPATGPLPMTRNAAIVQAAIFDAVNGIERAYTPIRVTADAPRGASKRAAAVQAAYATLVRLYAGQKAFLDAARASSLSAIASGAAVEHSAAISRGIQWGQTVADAILSWRSSDGIQMTGCFDASPNVDGRWRPTAPAPSNACAQGYPQFTAMTPWLLTSSSQFRPQPPPTLDSAQYAADLQEVYERTNEARANPAAPNTRAVHFWAAGTASAYWDRVALALAAERNLTFSATSRLMALMNVAMADAAIGCWDAKFEFVFWRPVSAIQQFDPSWAPLITTPLHPEYPSGHSCISGAAARILALQFGDANPFSLASNADPNEVREYDSFTAALDDVKVARVHGGIHFRTACDVGRRLGTDVAEYINATALRPLHGQRLGALK